MQLKHTEDYYIQTFLNKVKIRAIMAKDVIFLREDGHFSLVAEKFREYNIRHLPIINKKGQW